MEFRNLERTGLRVSVICLGTMTFAWTAPREAAAGVFDAMFDPGVLTGKYHDQGTIPKNSLTTVSSWVKAAIHNRSHYILEKLSNLAKVRGNSITQLALGWMLSLPIITSPIVGVNPVNQWDEIAGAVGLRLLDEENARVGGGIGLV